MSVKVYILKIEDIEQLKIADAVDDWFNIEGKHYAVIACDSANGVDYLEEKLELWLGVSEKDAVELASQIEEKAIAKLRL